MWGAHPLSAHPQGSHFCSFSSHLSPLAPNSKCSRGALYTGFSVLVALLLAGQATTAYFLYQQQGRLDKLTVTSQNLQLESLRMKLPKRACPTPTPPPLLWNPGPCPVGGGRLGPSSLGTGHTHAAPPAPTASKPLSKMRVSAPMLMQALPMEGPEVRPDRPGRGAGAPRALAEHSWGGRGAPGVGKARAPWAPGTGAQSSTASQSASVPSRPWCLSNVGNVCSQDCLLSTKPWAGKRVPM